MIDINCFFGQFNKSESELSKIDDLQEMIKDGIKKIFITSLKAVSYDAKKGNEEIIDFAGKYRDISPVMVFPIDLGVVGDVEYFLNNSTMLCRLSFREGNMVDQEDKTLNDFLKGYSDIGKGIIVQYSPEKHYLIKYLAKKYEKLSFILTDINYPQLRMSLGLFQNIKNIYMEISCFQLYRGLEYLIEKIGADKLIFGTNSPIYAYKSAILKLENAAISKDNYKLISEANIIRILGE